MLTPLRSVKKLIRSWFTPRKCQTILWRKAGIQLRLESLEDRLAPAGNILVSNGDLNAQPQHLQEYTPSGTLLRSITIPPAPGDTFDQARDLAEDPLGNIYVYDGTFTPALATYHPATNSWTQQTYPYWNTVAVTDYGGLTNYQNYVYATDDLVGNDPQGANGIVRFDIVAGTATRFFGGIDFSNVNMGLDGMLYALGTPGLDVINPITMSLVRTVNLNSNHDVDGVAVSAAGDIFTANLDNSVSHFSSTGTDIADLNTGHYSIGIDLAADGTVIVGANNGLVYEMTSALTITNTIDTGSGSAVFVKFAQPTETTTTLATSRAAVAYGTPVTFTATVTAVTPSPTGNVEFFDETAGKDLGAGTLQSSGVGTSTWTYVTTPTQLQVTGTADVIQAVFTSTSFENSSAQLPGGETVTPLTLTVNGITVSNKVYDGAVVATVNTAGATLAGVIAGDSVTLSTTGVTASFASKDVGNNIPLSVSGMTLGGPQAADYALAAGSVTLTANIAPAPLTVSGLRANNKVYDGTIQAVLNPSTASLSGIIKNDVVSLATSGAVAAFADKSVGTAVLVSVSGLSLSGAQAADYTVTQPITLSANITPAPLTVTGVAAANKVYDGTTQASLTVGTPALVGVLTGDTVTLTVNFVAGSFASEEVGNNIPVLLSGLTLGGPQASDYSTPTVTANITPRTISVSGVTPNNKVYDSTTLATMNLASVALSGVIAGDSVILGATGMFARKDAGASIPVSVTGLTLSGPQGGDYTPVLNQPSITATITPAPLAVSGVTAVNKVYDQTMNATVSTASATLVGTVYAGDSVTLVKSGVLGIFASASVGTAIPVAVSGLTLSSAQAGDYTLTQPTLAASIAPAPLAITGVTAANKVYDGMTQASLTVGNVSLAGMLPGDTVTLTITTLTGSFASKNAGNNILVLLSGLALGGPQASDYATPTLTANITPLSVNVSGLTANNKTYDATTVATVNLAGAVLMGVLAGDIVNLRSATGTFVSANVGNNIAVTVTNLTLSGAQASDYTPVLNQTAPTANITPAALTVTKIVADKVYDGTTSATLTPATAVLSGVFSGDSVSLITSGAMGTFAGKNPGTNILVTLAGLSLGGAQSGNYSLTPTSTANITPAPLTVTGITANSKLYDGTTVATLNVSNAALVGAMSGDSVTLVTSGAKGTFANNGPGTNIAVTVTGLALTGAQAVDYSLTPLALGANIVATPDMSDGGTGILTISLGANQTFAIVSLGTSYTFTSNKPFVASSATDPSNQSAAFTGLNTTTLTIASAGLAQYTGINIIDVGANASVTFNDSIGNYANNFTVTLSNPAAGSIAFNGKSAFGNFNLQASTTRNIVLNTGASLTSVSGNFTLQANLQTTPTNGNFAGVTLNGATLTSTGSGLIAVQGRGGNTGNTPIGVFLTSGAIISGGTGALTITGTGGAATGSGALGVAVAGPPLSRATVTSNGGNVLVTGYGGGTSSGSSDNYGVYVSGTVTAGGQGNVTLMGTGGQGNRIGNSYGVYISANTNAGVTSSGGNVSVIGQAGTGDSTGVGIGAGGHVSAGGMGTVTVTGTGSIDQMSSDTAQAYGVFLTGNVAGSAVITSSGGNVQVVGDGGVTGVGRNYGVAVGAGGLVTAGGQGSVSVTGTGGDSGSGSDYGVLVSGNTGNPATITSSGGNVQVTGVGGDNGSTMPTSGGQYDFGVSVGTLGIVGTLGMISAGGTGSVTVNGTGGAGSAGSNQGIYLTGQSTNSAVITSNGGNVSILGQGGYEGSGVYLEGGSLVTAGGQGYVTVTGMGGTGNTSGLNGVVFDNITGAGATISSGGGNVQIIGVGGAGSDSCNGVYVNSGGNVTAGGTGKVTIQGTGGTGAGGANNGVLVVGSNGTITSSGGDVQITGTGGNAGGGNCGVNVNFGRVISAGGNGNVTLQGAGGSSPGDKDIGVSIDDTYYYGTKITSAGGNVEVIGTGGGQGQSANDTGLQISGGALVTAGGAGSVTLIGVGGTSAGTGNDGFVLIDPSLRQAAVSSGGGNIVIDGSASSSSALAIHLSGYMVSTPAAGGTITLIGDNMMFSLGTINAGTRAVTVYPKARGVSVNLGGNNGPATLGLTSAEIKQITEGALQIGNSSSGTITISALITLPQATNVGLASGSDIVFNPGSIVSVNGALTLAPGITGAVRPLSSGNDASLFQGALSFVSGSNLAIAINGTTAQSQYNQLSVFGDVNLTGVTLILSGAFIPTAGQTFTIVNNQAAHPIIGMFNGLPQGAVIPNFLGSPLSAVISYVGGDGNDVVLTVEHPTTTIVTASAGTPIYGQPVTFNATVTTDAGIPTGSVEFFDDTTGADLGTGSLQNSSTGIATWALTTTPRQFQVTGGADTIRAAYAAAGSFLRSSGILAGGERIIPAPLTVTGITADNKVFDATTTATLNTASATLAGVIAGDTVTLNTAGANGTFASKDVGNNVIVNVSGLTISGPQVGDYTLILPTTAANITPAIVAHPPIPVIGNYNQLEGTTGYTPFIFHVSLAVAPAQPITYDVYTTDGSAVSTGTNPNFVAITPDVNGPHSIGTIGFAPGQVAQTITVYVIAGSLPASAGSKTFLVQMSNPTNPNVSLADGTGTIIPQNSPTRSAGGGLPKVLVGNSTMLEGASGLTAFNFNVGLATASPGPVTYDVYTTDGSAVSAGTNPNFMGITAGITVPYSHGTITFAPGQISQTVTVYVIAGSIPLSAGTKTFTVSLSDPAHPAIALATATGTIIPQNAQMSAATPAEARPPVMQKAVNRLTPVAAVTEARAVSVLLANSPPGTTATVATPQLAGQVFQIGSTSALNSLLYVNSPGQLAANWLFLILAREMDAPAEFNMLSSFQDSLSEVSAQHPDWLTTPSQFSATDSSGSTLDEGANTGQAVSRRLAVVDEVFAALGEEMDEAGENHNT